MAEAEYWRFTVARDCQKKNTSETHSECRLRCREIRSAPCRAATPHAPDVDDKDGVHRGCCNPASALPLRSPGRFYAGAMLRGGGSMVDGALLLCAVTVVRSPHLDGGLVG
jgi:hypothetical protein